MTLTLKPWMTGLLIATICVLAGFAAGQITQANSARDATASARATPVQDKATTGQLRTLNNAVRQIVDYQREATLNIDKMTENSYWTCRALAAAPHVCQ